MPARDRRNSTIAKASRDGQHNETRHDLSRCPLVSTSQAGFPLISLSRRTLNECPLSEYPWIRTIGRFMFSSVKTRQQAGAVGDGLGWETKALNERIH
jgi:hypothetical protein